MLSDGARKNSSQARPFFSRSSRILPKSKVCIRESPFKLRQRMNEQGSP
jgi:hypothetical protein